ncbi:MAG: hypothetical protein RML75_00555 [Cyanobacteriota bacterium SKYGB_h_bin112]|nr:hypothetical protein [Cyanobacteriota bacterium SKYGB_h_bin112]
MQLRCTLRALHRTGYCTVFTWARIPRDANGEVANTVALAPNWMIKTLSPDQS